MDGYTVKEAAAALGIPKKRVWELVARGVLNGRREGDRGMRVYLQPPDAADEDMAHDAPAAARRTDGRRSRAPAPEPAPIPEPIVEASPFRELLTEFRNLTERYGQALLALGEARGEVAALRSRVELLEARMDLRLPGGAPIPPVSWRTPEPILNEPIAPPAEPEADGWSEAPEPESRMRIPSTRSRRAAAGPSTAGRTGHPRGTGPRRRSCPGGAAGCSRGWRSDGRVRGIGGHRPKPAPKEKPSRAASPRSSRCRRPR